MGNKEIVVWSEEKVRKPEEFESKPVLNLESGKIYSLKILDDGVKVDCKLPDSDKKVKKLLLNVNYHGDGMVVFLPLGSTTESAFGQLRGIVDSRGGTLIGAMLNVTVAGEGKSKRYTIKLVGASAPAPSPGDDDVPRREHDGVIK